MVDAKVLKIKCKTRLVEELVEETRLVEEAKTNYSNMIC